MWNKVLSVLGYLNASPITLIGFIYVLFCTMMGWFRFVGSKEHALVWATCPENMPKWLYRRWEGEKFDLYGRCIGNVVILDSSDFKIDSPNDIKNIRTFTHEMGHVIQCMRMGIFQPIFYGLNWLGIKWGCPNSHAYYDLTFEIDARRRACQTIDVVGVRKKLDEKLQRNAKS